MAEHGLTTSLRSEPLPRGKIPISGPLLVKLPKLFSSPGSVQRTGWPNERGAVCQQAGCSSVSAPARMSGTRSAPEVVKRLVSRNVGAMLARNTVVGTTVFVLDLLLLWTLVALFQMDKLVAATIGFIVSTSVHYFVGRYWIFKGATRHLVSGYVYFLLSGGVGLAITILMFAAITSWTTINYLVARVIVSLFAGLASFLLNAVFTFQRV